MHIEYNLLCTQCNIDQFETLQCSPPVGELNAAIPQSRLTGWAGGGSQGQHKLCSGAVRKSKSAQVHTLQVQEGKYPKSHFEGLSGQHKSCFGALTKRTEFKFTTGMSVMCMANILDYTKPGQMFWIAQNQRKYFG